MFLYSSKCFIYFCDHNISFNCQFLTIAWSYFVHIPYFCNWEICKFRQRYQWNVKVSQISSSYSSSVFECNVGKKHYIPLIMCAYNSKHAAVTPNHLILNEYKNHKYRIALLYIWKSLNIANCYMHYWRMMKYMLDTWANLNENIGFSSWQNQR